MTTAVFQLESSSSSESRTRWKPRCPKVSEGLISHRAQVFMFLLHEEPVYFHFPLQTSPKPHVQPSQEAESRDLDSPGQHHFPSSASLSSWGYSEAEAGLWTGLSGCSVASLPCHRPFQGLFYRMTTASAKLCDCFFKLEELECDGGRRCNGIRIVTQWKARLWGSASCFQREKNFHGQLSRGKRGWSHAPKKSIFTKPLYYGFNLGKPRQQVLSPSFSFPSCSRQATSLTASPALVWSSPVVCRTLKFLERLHWAMVEKGYWLGPL